VVGDLRPDLASLAAFASYSVLSGQGSQAGDGLIPLETAKLDGAELISVEVLSLALPCLVAVTMIIISHAWTVGCTLKFCASTARKY
jgi:hypothetical protein